MWEGRKTREGTGVKQDGFIKKKTTRAKRTIGAGGI
jgi:hypothetical protein